MERVIWISGASSGIGAALARTVPYRDAQLVGIARRQPAAGEHLRADLSDPADWRRVSDSFERWLSGGRFKRADFLHFAGAGSPHGRASDADSRTYARSVLLNAASGPILGQAFLRICRRHGVKATLVMCSSPGALELHRGMAQYGASKAAVLHWTGVIREEEPESIVLAVIPWAVDTPMLREAIVQPIATNPMSGVLAEAGERGELAAPGDVAASIWEAVVAGAPKSPVHVGRPPADHDASTTSQSEVSV